MLALGVFAGRRVELMVKKLRNGLSTFLVFKL
jgi:hypothetical protein